MDWNICVMTKGETVFANTQGQTNAFSLIAPGALYHAGRLLRDIGESFYGNDEGLLIVPSIPAGLDESHAIEPHTWETMYARAHENGWRSPWTDGRAAETGWITWTHEVSGKKIHMGILNLMDQSRTPLFALDASAGAIAARVIEYHRVTGALWRMTAGVSGCVGIRANVAERVRRDNEQALRTGIGTVISEPHWRWDAAPDSLHGLGHMTWMRELVPAERHGSVYLFDIRAQFLAAMAAARIGWGKPSHTSQPVFDPERAGYWRIPASTLAGHSARPPLVDPKKIDKWGSTWVTTPAMVYFDSLGIRPAPSESWTTATSSQILKPWATRLRSVLDYTATADINADPRFIPAAALKRTYTETIGMFTVTGGSIYRPDWRDTIIDLARVNMMRKLDRARQVLGVWPVKIYHDAVYYPGAEDDRDAIASAIGVNINIGKFKYQDTMSALEYVRKAGQ
jgi:hypothetical protein